MSTALRSRGRAGTTLVWTSRDTIALAAVSLLAAVLRFWDLGVPDELTFDERYYAPDACVLVQGEAACDTVGFFSRVHPFLARWIIGAGIEVFGYRPFGWRFAAAVFGVAAVAMLFLLARRLLRSTTAATLAAGLLTLDGLHFLQSRLAMLDIFVATFGLASFLFVVTDRDRVRRPDERLRDRPWLLAAGAAAGAATASKWSGLPFLVMVVVMSVVWDLRDDGGSSRAALRSLRSRVSLLLVAFVAIPAAIYVVSSIGAFEGRVLALPWERGSWPRSFLGWQKHILTFGLGIEGVYPYTSPAWSWPLLRRPVIYALDTGGGTFRHILAVGNPAIWWPAIVAVVVCAVRWLRGRGGPEAVILAGVAAGYLWWIPVTSTRTFSFLFYMTPVLPFMCLALARAAQLLWPRVVGRVVVVTWILAVIGLFAFFYPVLAYRPLDEDAWTARLWFTDCRPESLVGDPPRPRTDIPTPPPEGWCWI